MSLHSVSDDARGSCTGDEDLMAPIMLQGTSYVEAVHSMGTISCAALRALMNSDPRA
jgi:hypothetical protein